MATQINFRLLENDANNLHQYCTQYIKDANVCSGVHTLNIDFTPNCPDLIVGSKIVLYEYDYDSSTYVKERTYYVNQPERDHNTGIYSVSCQDSTKWLQDYFIDDVLITDTNHTARHWAEHIIQLTTLSVDWQAEHDGIPVEAEISLGMQSAYESLTTICQQNGWYFYINSSNEVVVGSIDFHPSNYVLDVDNYSLLGFNVMEDDEMLRNRAVVWGGTDWNTHNNIFSDLSTTTGFERNPDDKRAVLISNGAIGNQEIADEMANQILAEFARISIVKELVIDGTLMRGIQLGDGIKVTHSEWTGIGMITNISHIVSQQGSIATVTLDERCPRLFAYFKQWYFPGFSWPDLDFGYIPPYTHVYTPTQYMYAGMAKPTNMSRKSMISTGSWEDTTFTSGSAVQVDVAYGIVAYVEIVSNERLLRIQAPRPAPYVDWTVTCAIQDPITVFDIFDVAYTNFESSREIEIQWLAIHPESKYIVGLYNKIDPGSQDRCWVVLLEVKFPNNYYVHGFPPEEHRAFPWPRPTANVVGYIPLEFEGNSDIKGVSVAIRDNFIYAVVDTSDDVGVKNHSLIRTNIPLLAYESPPTSTYETIIYGTKGTQNYTINPFKCSDGGYIYLSYTANDGKTNGILKSTDGVTFSTVHSETLTLATDLTYGPVRSVGAGGYIQEIRSTFVFPEWDHTIKFRKILPTGGLTTLFTYNLVTGSPDFSPETHPVEGSNNNISPHVYFGHTVYQEPPVEFEAKFYQQLSGSLGVNEVSENISRDEDGLEDFILSISTDRAL